MVMDLKIQIFMEFVKSAGVKLDGIGSIFTKEYFDQCFSEKKYSQGQLDHTFEYLLMSGYFKKVHINLGGKTAYMIAQNIQRLIEWIEEPELFEADN